jgi:hypothetical protein
MFDFFVFSNSESTRVKNRFNKIKEIYPHARLLTYNGNTSDMILKARQKALTQMFWLLDVEVNIVNNFDFYWKPEKFDQQYIHVWQTVNGKNIHQGLSLWPKNIKLDANNIEIGNFEFKLIDNSPTSLPNFDVFVFSEIRNNRIDFLFNKIKEKYSNSKLIISNNGIIEQIKTAQILSTTKMFMFFNIDYNINNIQQFTPDIWDYWYINVVKHSDNFIFQECLTYWPSDRQIVEDEFNTMNFSNIKFINFQNIEIMPYTIVFFTNITKNNRIENKYNLYKLNYINSYLLYIEDIKELMSKIQNILPYLTKMFWLVNIDNTIDNNFDLHFKPIFWNQYYVHVWGELGCNIFNSVSLWPSDINQEIIDEYTVTNIKYIDGQALIKTNNSLVFFTEHFNNTILNRFNDLKNLYPTSELVYGYKDNIELIELSKNKVFTPMFWLLNIDYNLIENFDLTWIPEPWDKQYIHIWNNTDIFNTLSLWLSDSNQNIDNVKIIDNNVIYLNPYDIFVYSNVDFSYVQNKFNKLKELYNNIQLLICNDNIQEIINLAKSITTTKMFWLFNIEYNLDSNFDVNWKPNSWDQEYVHICNIDSSINILNKLSLWPSTVDKTIQDNYTISDIKYIENTQIIFDNYCIFVQSSIDNIYVRRRFDKLKELYNNIQLLICNDNIQEIINLAKSITTTKMFWLFNIEYNILANFDINWRPNSWDQQYIHRWTNVNNKIIEGLSLWPSDFNKIIENEYTISDIKIFDNVGVKLSNYCLFLISYNKDCARIQNKFNKIKEVYNNIQLIFIDDNIVSAAIIAQKFTNTSMFWLLDIESELCFDLEWRPPIWDKDYIHTWKTNCGNTLGKGLSLWPSSYVYTNNENLNNIKFIELIGATYTQYNIFFISFNESNADNNFNELLKIAPNAIRVNGIKGINNAHKYCAELSTTEMFWTIDADTIIDNSFNFNFRPEIYDKQYLHLWRSRNPVNGLEYGYGAVKLWPSNAPLEYKGNWLDFTTSVGNIKIVEQVISTTCFNSSEYDSWRSGFREAVKLAYNIKLDNKNESLNRLLVWLNKTNNVPFATEAKNGARHGLDYFICYGHNKDMLKNINDFNWLKVRYKYVIDTGVKMPNIIKKTNLLQMMGI